MDKSFVTNWILFNSLAVIAAGLTVFMFPIVATPLIVIIQTALLYKYLGHQSFWWLLNPVFALLSLYLFSYGSLFGVIGISLGLEIVFAITTKKFSWFIWSAIVMVPFSVIFWMLEIRLFNSNFPLWITSMFLLFALIWTLEALFIDRFVLSVLKRTPPINILDE